MLWEAVEDIPLKSAIGQFRKDYQMLLRNIDRVDTEEKRKQLANGIWLFDQHMEGLFFDLHSHGTPLVRAHTDLLYDKPVRRLDKGLREPAWTMHLNLLGLRSLLVGHRATGEPNWDTHSPEKREGVMKVFKDRIYRAGRKVVKQAELIASYIEDAKLRVEKGVQHAFSGLKVVNFGYGKLNIEGLKRMAAAAKIAKAKVNARLPWLWKYMPYMEIRKIQGDRDGDYKVDRNFPGGARIRINNYWHNDVNRIAWVIIHEAVHHIWRVGALSAAAKRKWIAVFQGEKSAILTTEYSATKPEEAFTEFVTQMIMKGRGSVPVAGLRLLRHMLGGKLKESIGPMEFACTACSFVNETRQGQTPRYCGNCGSDLGQQENYPCQSIEQPSFWSTPTFDIVKRGGGTLNERMTAWNAIRDLCEAVHSQAGWSMVPWSPNHRVLHLESIQSGKAHFSIYAPYVEARGKVAGTCQANLDELTPSVLRHMAERVLSFHTEDYESLTLLPKALSEVDARPRTPGMPGMGAGTAGLPYGSGGGTVHGKDVNELHGDMDGSGPGFGPTDKGEPVNFSQGYRREQPKSEDSESTVDDPAMTAPLPPDRRKDVSESLILTIVGIAGVAAGLNYYFNRPARNLKGERVTTLGSLRPGEKVVWRPAKGDPWKEPVGTVVKAEANRVLVSGRLRKRWLTNDDFKSMYKVYDPLAETAKTSPAPGNSRDLSVSQAWPTAHGDSQPIRSSKGKPKGKTVTDQSGDMGGLYGTPFEESFSCILDEAEYFQMTEGIHDPHILKAVFMAGGGGSGKGWVSKNMFAGMGLKVVNSDDVLEAFAADADLRAKFRDLAHLRPGEQYDLGKNADMMSPDIQKLIRPKAKVVAAGMMGLYMKGRLGLIIDSTGRRMASIQKTKKLLEEAGYDTAMVFVDVDIETAQRRNLQRPRKVDPKVLTKAHKEIRTNIPDFKAMFGSSYIRVDNRDVPSGKVPEVTTAMRRAGMKLLRGKVRNSRGREWIQAQKNAIKMVRGGGGKKKLAASRMDAYDHVLSEALGDGETASRETTDYATLGSKSWDAAVAVVVKGHRDILIGKVAQTAADDRAGTWCFPGGGLDPEDGGDPVAAAIREAMEETGVTVTSEGKILSHKDKPGVAFVVCEYVKGDLAPNEEFTSLEWMPYVARHDFPGLYPPNRAILERIPAGMIKGKAGQNESVEDFLLDLRSFLDEKGLSKGTKIGGTTANAIGKDRQVSAGSPAEPSKNAEPGTTLKAPDKQKEISTALSDLSKEVKTLSPPKDPNDATSPDSQKGADDARAKLQKDAEKEKEKANGNGATPGAPSAGGAKAPPPKAAPGQQPPAQQQAPGQPQQPPQAQQPQQAPPGQQPGQNGPQAPPNGKQPPQAGQPDQNGSKVKIGADGSMTVQQGPQAAGQQPPGQPGQPGQQVPGQPGMPGQQQPMPGQDPFAQPGMMGQPGMMDQPGSLHAAKAVNLTFLDKQAADRGEKWLAMSGVPPVGRDGTTVQISVQNPDQWAVVKATAKAFGLEMAGLV